MATGSAINVNGGTVSNVNVLSMKGSISGLLTFNVPNTVTPYSITWPAAQSSGSKALLNDGSGNLSWSSPFANQDLSNLTNPTSINQSLIPSGAFDIGSNANKWVNLFISGTANVVTLEVPTGSGTHTELTSSALNLYFTGTLKGSVAYDNPNTNVYINNAASSQALALNSGGDVRLGTYGSAEINLFAATGLSGRAFSAVMPAAVLSVDGGAVTLTAGNSTSAGFGASAILSGGLATGVGGAVLIRSGEGGPNGNVTIQTGVDGLTGTISLLSNGVTISSALNMDSFNINNVLNPVAPQDAATKSYVDSKFSGSFTAGQSFSANTSYPVRWGIVQNGEMAGRIYTADISGAFDFFYVIGMLLSTSPVSPGDDVPLVRFGDFTLGSLDTPFNTNDQGKALFLTASGTFSVVAPSNPGESVTRIGIVVTTTTIDVDPIYVSTN